MTLRSRVQALRKQSFHWLYFVGFWLASNVAVWVLALAYLKLTSPTYTSEWTATLPGSGSSTNVDVPGIGRAVSESDSPYKNSSQDPRENYKFIAQSPNVREIASDLLDLSEEEEIDKPDVEIVANTTLIQFSISGISPEDAQRKGEAIHNALEIRLNQLRKEEIEREDRLLKASLSSAQESLQSSQKLLSSYKARSNLTSPDQLQDLSRSIEQLRSQRAQVIAQSKQFQARLDQLSSNLDATSQQAADALALTSDPLFQKHLTAYSAASSELVILESKFSYKHPEVIAKQAEKVEIQTALADRLNSLLGEKLTLDRSGNNNPGQDGSRSAGLPSNRSIGSGLSAERETLYRDLILLETEQQGLNAQAQELARQIEFLEGRLRQLGVQISTLEGLRRNVQIAEAIFTSTLTKLDLSKSETFASYPPLQKLTDPSLPYKASAPRKKLVLLGALMGSFFFTTGSFSLWWRDRRIRKTRNLRQQEEETLQRSIILPDETNATPLSDVSLKN